MGEKVYTEKSLEKFVCSTVRPCLQGFPQTWVAEQCASFVADFLEFGETLALDALDRKESCGGHFREESQTTEGEALRKDDEFSYTAAWEYNGSGQAPSIHKEDLAFENVKLTQRSYK